MHAIDIEVCDFRQGDLAQAVDYCKQALEIEQDELRRHQVHIQFPFLPI